MLENPKTYNIPRSDIADTLLLLLSLPHLQVEHKRLFWRVFALYVSHPIDYVDAYHAALVEQYSQGELLSFDRHFDLVDGLKRIEPG